MPQKWDTSFGFENLVFEIELSNCGLWLVNIHDARWDKSETEPVKYFGFVCREENEYYSLWT